MAKRLKVSLLGILTVLMCFALAFGLTAWNTTTASAETVSEDGTTVTLNSKADFTIENSVIKDYATDSSGMPSFIDPDTYYPKEGITKIIFDIPDGIIGIEFNSLFLWLGQTGVAVTLNIPASVISLDTKYTSFSSVLIDAINIDENNTKYSLDGGMLIEKDTHKLIWAGANTSIPDSVEIVCDGAFNSNVTSIHIPASVKTIEKDVLGRYFANLSLNSITIDAANTVYSDGNANCLIEKETNKLVMVTKGTTAIPDGVKIIGSKSMFAGFGFTEIIIPNSVEQIVKEAFVGCAGLQKLSVPFVGTSRNSGTIEDFFGRAGSGYVGIGVSVYMPSSLKEINITGSGLVLHDKALYPGYGVSSYGFKNATNLTKVTVPDDITFDGNNIIDPEAHFFVEDENGNKYLGNDTNDKVIIVSVANKTNLTEIIPEGVCVINENAYQNAKMVEVVLPQTLKQICSNAFNGCTDIVSVYNLSELNIQKGSEEHGKVALYANSVYTEFNCSKIDSTTIEGYTFIADDIPVLYRYTGADTNITLPANYDGKRYNIADNAFKGNETLIDVVVPAMSALNIGESAFEGCTSLKSVVINDLENSIGNAAFKGCTALNAITFYNCHITEIANEAFMNCSSLLSIVVPESVTTIGTSAFENCSSAVAITLGYKVEYIGGKAFADTKSLKTATIPDSVIALGYGGGEILVGNPWTRDYVFAGSGIESVYIGSGVKYLGYTFADCVNLKEVIYSKDSSLLDISYAFQGCSALTTLTIPEGVVKATTALSGAVSLTSLYVPYSFIEAYNGYSNLFDSSYVYNEYAPLTMYLPEVQGETDEEKAASANKILTFALYFDNGNYWAHYMNTLVSYTDTQWDGPADKTEENYAQWLNGATDTYHAYSVFANVTIILPSKATYDAVYSILSDVNYYKTLGQSGRKFNMTVTVKKTDGTGNVTLPLFPEMSQDSLLAKFYYVTDVTYELYKQMSGGSTKKIDTQTVQKLASNEGADIRYVLKTDKYGSKYYAIDESYAMPTIIGATSATGDWKVGSVNGEAFVLNGAKINGATTLVNVLGADAKLEITVDNEYTATYNGKEWTLPASLADKASITSVNGNADGKILNAGTYTVVLTAGADYEFADGQSTATVTVVIDKADAELVWTYDGEKVLSEDETFVKTFDGTAIKSKLAITYVDAKGETQTINLDHLSRTLNGTATMGDAVGAGDWVLYLSDLIRDTQYPNYIFAHASQSFRINNVRLSANDVLNGTEIDLEGAATLNSGMLYIYEDNSHNIIPSRTPMTGYTLVEVINVERSIVRYTNREWTLAATVKSGSADKLALNADGTANNTQTAIGRQTTTFVFNAKDNYEFASSINGGVAERGIAFTVSADGKTLTVTKTWYVVQLANELVKATYTGTNEPTDDDLYTVIDWTYGADVSFALPKLWHGSDADNVNHVKFTLNLHGKADAIVSNAARADLLIYLNKYMPAGDYTLTFTVDAFDTADASYPTFSRIYDFTVAKATIGIDSNKLPKDETTGYASYEWELTANANKEMFFKAFADKINAAGVLQTVVMDAPEDTFWGTNDGKAYFGTYSVKYNFARMNNERYELATNNYLYEFIAGGSRGTYTVYFQIEMPNHENLTNVGEDGRYAYFFTVVVYETVDPVDIRLDNVKYTGLKNIPTLNETDVYHVEYVENDEYIDAGEHALILVLNDSVHYRWKGVAAGETGLSVNYTIEKALNEFIEAPDIVRWVEGKFNADENGFIGAAKFGTISYVITDTNDNVIYDLSQNIDKRADMKAGTYILKATVVGNDNYNGLTESFTIRILEKIGLPWWGTLLIVIGALLLAALIIFILWKKGVFQILTEKIVVAIRTKASVDATIASVRTAKRMEEGRRSVADAKRRERIEEMRKKAAEQRALPPEERAAQLEEKAKLDEERAEKLRARSEAKRQKAAKMRGETVAEQQPTEVEQEAAATETPETPTEE